MRNQEPMMYDLQQIQHKIQEHLRTHWRLFLIEGGIFTLLGISAIVIPQFFSVVMVIFLGWLAVIAGITHVSRALFLSQMPHFGLWLFLGLLQIILGYLLIADPMAGVLTLTTLMVLFFSCEGAIKIYLAFMLRPLPHWQALLFSGVTALIFAVIIFVTWAESSHWLLGLFLGINMVILGISIIKMSLFYKNSV